MTHRPPHKFVDNSFYLISSATYNHNNFLNTPEHLDILLDIFNESVSKFAYDKFGWVFLPNHYHILINCQSALKLPKFINYLHSKSAFLLNRLDKCCGRKIWYQYFDTCIRKESDLYTRLNYIHHNPVKHKASNNMDKYVWSSYKYWVENIGNNGVAECFEKYPIKDFTLQGEI